MGITATLRSPSPNAVGVPVDANVTVTIAAPGEVFQTAKVFVDDVVGFDYSGGFYIFNPPAVRGTAATSDELLVVTLRLRRRFAPGTPVVVRIVARTNATAETSYEARFFAALPASSLRDQDLRRTRVDASFPSSTRALELLRRTLEGAVGTGNGSLRVALVHRVKRSQLASLLPATGDNVAEAIDRLLPSEVASVDDLDAALAVVSFLWTAAREELLTLGVAPLTVDALDRSRAAPYPQERVAAVALALLLAADALE